jgi:hypothetical protein
MDHLPFLITQPTGQLSSQDKLNTHHSFCVFPPTDTVGITLVHGRRCGEPAGQPVVRRAGCLHGEADEGNGPG